MAMLLTMSTPTITSDERLTSVRRRSLKKLRVMTKPSATTKRRRK
jgi:hypothetical protein